jgi:hypothetical protein
LWCWWAESVGVFIAVLIFQFSITMSLIIVCVLLMVDLEVYGFIYVIGAKLNYQFTKNVEGEKNIFLKRNFKSMRTSLEKDDFSGKVSDMIHWGCLLPRMQLFQLYRSSILALL